MVVACKVVPVATAATAATAEEELEDELDATTSTTALDTGEALETATEVEVELVASGAGSR